MKQVSIPEKDRVCHRCGKTIQGLGVIVRAHGERVIFHNLSHCYREWQKRKDEEHKAHAGEVK